MFGKEKGKGTPGADKGAKKEAEAATPDMAAPPLKPFSKSRSHAPSKPSSTPFRPEIPRRVTEIPGGPGRTDRVLSLDDEANRLTVGRNIRLTGEITSCEKLVVEGQVEASLTDAHTIVIAPHGHFKGNASVAEADISGRFEGTLVAQDKLTIRKDGCVDGSVRYGKIVIEAGGKISGDMASLDSDEYSDSGNSGPTNK
ncbi:MAG: polymer-forming cytoskeletal protein [Rhodospirillales bacterium]|jgi:cytoskeletal protein CcmA (bactofilin family)|nr:polymer-forming cytoskeletal protein [Rhodospirillales bacterium]